MAPALVVFSILASRLLLTRFLRFGAALTMCKESDWFPSFEFDRGNPPSFPIAVFMSSCDIHSLPPETLSEIFRFTVAAVTRPFWAPRQPLPAEERQTELERIANAPLLMLSQVCSRWHEMAINNPTLWSTVEVSSVVAHTPALLQRTITLLDARLARSRSAPLLISLAVNTDGPPFHPHIFEPLAEHSHRWESVEVVGFLEGVDTSVLRGKLPRLARLLIPGYTETVQDFAVAPRLKKLCIAAALLHSQSLDDLRLEHLQSFECAVALPAEFEVWPHAEFLMLCERSGLAHCLRTLHIVEVRIAECDLLQVLLLLATLERLEIGDAPEKPSKRKQRGKVGKTKGLITDNLLRAMSHAPGRDCLVPSLSYFGCVSRLKFTHSLLVDFAMSRVARLPVSSSFHLCILRFPGTNTVLTSTVRTALSDLAADNNEFIYEADDLAERTIVGQGFVNTTQSLLI
ncbi:hypothetical protein K438DRAFT_1776859 [Mycena galopus ATCC 62051]|nr:hypothetical protein K438DRAFT_1776859 [Mycena galopus ATCC 62051]